MLRSSRGRSPPGAPRLPGPAGAGGARRVARGGAARGWACCLLRWAGGGSPPGSPRLPGPTRTSAWRRPRRPARSPRCTEKRSGAPRRRLSGNREEEEGLASGTVRGSDLGSTTHVVPGMTEEQAAKARRLDAPTVVAVLLVIPALVLHFSEPRGALGVASVALNWAIYAWFLFEFVYMLWLAPEHRGCPRPNKTAPTAPLLTVPLLPGVLQALWV